MKFLKYTFIGILSLLTLVIAGAYLTLQLVDLNHIKQLISDQVLHKTGRHLDVAGAIEPTIGYTPTITLHDISLSNPAWSQSKTLLQAKEIHVALQLMPLLHGNVVVNKIRVSGAIVDLEKDNKGRTSWSFEPSDEGTESTKAASKDKTAANGDASNLVISEIDIADSQIHYLATGKKQSLAIKDATVKGVHGKNVDQFTTNASYEDAALSLQGSVNSETAMIEGSVSANDATVGFKGNYALSDSTFDMMVTIKAESVKALAALAKQTVDDANALTLSASIGGKPDVFNVKDLKLTYGDIEADGKMDVNLTADKPYVGANIHIPTLSTVSVSGEPKADASPTENAAEAPSSLDAPLPLDALNALNTNFKLTIDTLKTPSLTLTQLNATTELKDKKLTIEPVSAQLSGGAVSGSVVLDASEATPTLMLTMLSQQINVESLMKELGGSSDVKNGVINTKILLNGSGHSIRKLIGSSNGEINLFVDGAKYDVPKSTAQTLQFLNLLGKGDTIDVSCAVGQFDVKNGVATSKALALKTPAAIALGNGAINLAGESLNLMLKLDTSSIGVSDMVPPMRISGPFKQLSIVPDPKASLASLGKLVLGDAAGAEVSAALGEKPEDKFAVMPGNHPCLNAIAQAQQSHDKNKSLKGAYKSIEKSVAAKRDALKQKLQNIGSDVKLDNPLKGVGEGFKGFMSAPKQ